MQADRKCVAASACSNRNSSARSPRLPTRPPLSLSGGLSGMVGDEAKNHSEVLAALEDPDEPQELHRTAKTRSLEIK